MWGSVEMGKIKTFLKRTAIATIIFGGYYLFYNQIDTDMVRWMSQKKGEAVIGMDFEAYKSKEPLGMSIPKKGDSVKDAEGKVIENWAYISGYELSSWMKKAYSNTISFTPYCSEFRNDEQKLDASQKKESIYALEKEVLERGDSMLKDLYSYVQKPDHIILRVKGDKKIYENLHDNDPLTTVTKKIAKGVSDNEDKVMIDLETPDDGDYKAHNDRINLIREINPKLKIATTLDKKDSYDEKTGLWNPAKSKQYWEKSDIIILEDYFSDPDRLEKSIKKFKGAARGKQVWVRVITGSRKINERQMKSLEAELEEYEKNLGVVLKYADGCLANDTNGIWLFSSTSYDKNERFDTTKRLYKKVRKIKIEHTTPSAYN